MLPTYKPGDQVLTFNWYSSKVGDVIVFKKDGMNMIKRVKKIENNKFYLEGDNQKESSKIGWIEKKYLIGKVVGRI
jgi:phage repressor protein C with HTH and peptisase S24 domain